MCKGSSLKRIFIFHIYTYNTHTHMHMYIFMLHTVIHMLVLVPSETLEDKYFVYNLQYSDLGSTAPESPGLLVKNQITEFQFR